MRKFTKYPLNINASEQMSFDDLPDPDQLSIDNLTCYYDDLIETRIMVNFNYSTPIPMSDIVKCVETTTNDTGYIYSGGFFIADLKNQLINDYNERGFSEWADEYDKNKYDAYIDYCCLGDFTSYEATNEFRRALRRNFQAMGCEVVDIIFEYGW